MHLPPVFKYYKISGYFDKNTTFQRPEYDDSDKKDLEEIINGQNKSARPFHITSLEKIPLKRTVEQGFRDEKIEIDIVTDQIFLKGHYETFDGLRLEIEFEGEYGDPERFDGFPINADPRDAFRSYQIKSKLKNTAHLSEREFEIKRGLLRSIDLSFISGTRLWSEKKEFNNLSNPAFSIIRNIGRIVEQYDLLHSEEVVQRFISGRDYFFNSLSHINVVPSFISFTFFGCDLDQQNIEKNRIDFRFDAAESRQTLLNQKISNTKEIVPYHEREYEHSIWYTSFSDTTNIEVSLDGRILFKFHKFLNRIKSFSGKKSNSKLNSYDFLMLGLNFFSHQSNLPEEIYSIALDTELRKARKCQDEDYVPLYFTTEESVRFDIEGFSENEFLGTYYFPSVESFHLFETFMNLIFLEGQTIDDLMVNQFPLYILSKSKIFYNRFSKIYELYKEGLNEEQIRNKLKELDPAYKIAKKAVDYIS